MPAQAPKRELIQQTFENGIILGYSHREHEVPPGFCLKAHNVVIQEDGSLAPRPPVMVTYPNGHGAGAADVDWDQAITAKHRVLLENDDSFHVAGRTSPTHVAAPLGGTSVPTGSTAFWVQYMIVGEAASYGNTTVVPVARPTYDSVSDPAGGPAVGRLAVVHALTFNNSAVVPSAVSAINLYDTNGHAIVQEAVQQQQTVGDAVFARMVALSWKSRIFIIAGTQVTYSAPGQPTVYAAASGGGFFNLDTDSQIVGAFILDDNLYMVTRRELFVFNFSSIPGVDGELRKIAKVQGLGGAEYDNIGYIAVREGLYRIIGGQLEPTFIPSSESHMSFQTYGWPDIDNSSSTDIPERIEIPPHCVISKIGDQILLSGIGTNLVELEDQIMVYNPVFSTTMEAWVTWGGRSRGLEGISRWFNLLTPLIRTDVQDQWGSEQYVGTNIEDRTENLASRMRSFTIVNAENEDSSWDQTGTQIMRYADTFVEAGAVSFLTAEDIRPEIQTPYYAFEDPLSLKRLHVMWLTGHFKPGNQVEGLNSSIDDRNDIAVRAFVGPNDAIQVVNYGEDESDSRFTPNLFDISPMMIKFLGAIRFLYIGVSMTIRLLDQDEPLLTANDDTYKFPNFALSSVHFDVTKYSSKSNRAY